MGNLQSERIFSENHRNSSSSKQSPWGGTSESTGHLKDRCWAHHSRSGPKGNSHKQKRRRTWSYIYHCGRNNNLLLCWKWAAPSRGWNRTVPHKGKLAPITGNQRVRCTGFAVLVFFYLLFVRLYNCLKQSAVVKDFSMGRSLSSLGHASLSRSKGYITFSEL